MFEKYCFSLVVILLSFNYVSTVGREGLRLVLEDKFDASSKNMSVWNYNYPWGSTYKHRANMIRRQVTTPDLGEIKLTAIATKTSTITNLDTGDYGIIDIDYTSGAIHTNSLNTLKRGLTIVSMRVPSVPSTWPMIMLVPLDQTSPMLIMDVFDDRRNIGYTFRYTSSTGSSESVSGVTRSSVDNSLDYHSYAIDWGYDKVSFLIDNILLRSFTKPTELTQISDMSLVIALGVGGRSQATSVNSTFYPASLLVNNVQMWEPKYNGRYKIVNYKSKLVLEVQNGLIANFAQVVQNTDRGTLWQQWNIYYVGYNTYRIVNINSGKVLDVYDWQTNDGAKVLQYTFEAKDNQIWRIHENEDADNTVTIVNVFAQKPASFIGGSTLPGSPLVLNESNDGADQKWILIRL